MSDKYASEYPLPGGVEQYFDTLLVLLRHVGEKTVDQEAVRDFIFQTYPQTRGSTAVAGYIGQITRMGLWAAKEGQVRLTPEGSDLIERADADPVAAKRALLEIKRQRIAGYDEMLSLVRDQTLSMDAINSQLQAALGVHYESKNQCTFRLNWLRSLGFLEREGHDYHLTPAGSAVAKDLPPAEQYGDGNRPPGQTLSPGEPPQPMPLVQRATELADRVKWAATQGKDGSDLETSTAEAFAFLGFDAQVVSGPGNPDVVLTAPMGEAGYRVLIDTKSRASGCVQQNDVNFNALTEHKAKVNADYVMVLGGGFSAGNLEKWAGEQNVRLLTTEELRQVLIAHAEGVIALDRLEALFRGGGATDEAGVSEVWGVSAHTVQALSLARLVYDAVRDHQEEEGALNAHSLFYILAGEHPIQAIQAIVDLLQSELIGALAKTDKGSLYARLTPRTLDDKLAQLQHVLGGHRKLDHRNSNAADDSPRPY